MHFPSVPGASPNTGYFGGGYVPGSSPSSTATMDKTNFANDTTATVPNAALSAGRGGISGASNLTDGYFAGGKGIPVHFQQWIRLLMHLIPQQQFLVQN